VCPANQSPRKKLTLSNKVATKNFLSQRCKRAKEEQRKTFAPSRLCARKVLFVISLFVLLLAACNSNDPQPTPVISSPPTGTTYPMPPAANASLANMGWELPGGKRSVFSEYKGKVLVLDFYATWCLPCRDSVPHLIGMQKKYAERGLSVVGLNVGGPGDEQQVPAFAKEFGIQYPLAKPDEDLVSFLLGNDDGIPQTFVFDRHGQLVQRFLGFGPETGKYLDSAVETALQTSAP
jgi:cytochrome c biogenesis protein CcmG/thiol:disulfide interchange protein DsbE